MAKRTVDPEISGRPFACSAIAGKLGAITAGRILARDDITGVLLAACVYL